MARLLGNVRITRGDNQINGREAIVNLRTGVARLVSAPGARVQGLVVPQQQQPSGEATPGARPAERRTP
jgi:lipopolysaccharide export system protein LptA